MTLAKYNEIMDHVEMSDEMKSRILSHADHHFAKKKRKKTLRILLPVIGMAAAAALILAIAKPWSGRTVVQDTEVTGGTEIPGIVTGTETPTVTGGTMTGGTEDQFPGMYQMAEYSSAQELEKAAGFPVKELTALPFQATERKYLLITGTIAEELFRGAKGDLSFRKSKGKEDNSGVYMEYTAKKTADVGGIRVSLSGEGSTFHLILWTDSEYSYSLYSEQGISEEAALTLAEEIIK